MNGAYPYALSLTSQFFYCGLPLRLDSYSACQYACTYCFARARGGARRARSLQVADARSLRNRLERIAKSGAKSVVDEFLLQRQPLHLGGMTDPFPPIESVRKATHDILHVLGVHNYPTVISTKGADELSDRHIELLQNGAFIVQISISSLDQRLMKAVDVGTPGPDARLAALSLLNSAGVPTACRIQPVLPTREEEVLEIIHACEEAGVCHVAVEHLKLPIERRWAGTRQLSTALGLDLFGYFFSRGSSRVGREWVLPVDERLPRMLRWRSHGGRKPMPSI